jgi:hypothetical protein
MPVIALFCIERIFFELMEPTEQSRMNLKPPFRLPIVQRLTVFSLPVIFLVCNLFLLAEYTGDDAFIHFTYVRNILERGVFSFNTATPTYGSTSILWVIAGSVTSFLSGTIPDSMKTLSGLLYLAAAFMALYYLIGRFHDSPLTVVLLLIVFLSNAVIFRWMTTGMETNLILVVMMITLLYYDPERPLLGAALCLLGYLVRPEMLLLPLSHILVRGVQKRGHVLRFALFTVTVFGCWFLAARLYFGTFLPLTLVKSSGGPDAESVFRFITVVGGSYPVLLTVLTGIAFHRWKARSPLPETGFSENLLGVFAALLLLFYLVTGTTVISRYLVLLHVPFFGLIVRWVRWEQRRHLLLLLAGIVVIVHTALFVQLHLPAARSFVTGFQATYERIGRMLAVRDEGDTARVMLSDVGMVGYYSRRPIIDTQGLTSPHVYRARSGNEFVLVRTYRPEYLVVKLHGLAIEEYRKRLMTLPDVREVRVLFHDVITPLGVLARSSWNVYVLTIGYT